MKRLFILPFLLICMMLLFFQVDIVHAETENKLNELSKNVSPTNGNPISNYQWDDNTSMLSIDILTAIGNLFFGVAIQVFSMILILFELSVEPSTIFSPNGIVLAFLEGATRFKELLWYLVPLVWTIVLVIDFFQKNYQNMLNRLLQFSIALLLFGTYQLLLEDGYTEKVMNAVDEFSFLLMGVPNSAASYDTNKNKELFLDQYKKIQQDMWKVVVDDSWEIGQFGVKGVTVGDTVGADENFWWFNNWDLEKVNEKITKNSFKNTEVSEDSPWIEVLTRYPATHGVRVDLVNKAIFPDLFEQGFSGGYRLIIAFLVLLVTMTVGATFFIASISFFLSYVLLLLGFAIGSYVLVIFMFPFKMPMRMVKGWIGMITGASIAKFGLSLYMGFVFLLANMWGLQDGGRAEHIGYLFLCILIYGLAAVGMVFGFKKFNPIRMSVDSMFHGLNGSRSSTDLFRQSEQYWERKKRVFDRKPKPRPRPEFDFGSGDNSGDSDRRQNEARAVRIEADQVERNQVVLTQFRENDEMPENMKLERDYETKHEEQQDLFNEIRRKGTISAKRIKKNGTITQKRVTITQPTGDQVITNIYQHATLTDENRFDERPRVYAPEVIRRQATEKQVEVETIGTCQRQMPRIALEDRIEQDFEPLQIEENAQQIRQSTNLIDTNMNTETNNEIPTITTPRTEITESEPKFKQAKNFTVKSRKQATDQLLLPMTNDQQLPSLTDQLPIKVKENPMKDVVPNERPIQAQETQSKVVQLFDDQPSQQEHRQIEVQKSFRQNSRTPNFVVKPKPKVDQEFKELPKEITKQNIEPKQQEQQQNELSKKKVSNAKQSSQSNINVDRQASHQPKAEKQTPKFKQAPHFVVKPKPIKQNVELELPKLTDNKQQENQQKINTKSKPTIKEKPQIHQQRPTKPKKRKAPNFVYKPKLKEPS